MNLKVRIDPELTGADREQKIEELRNKYGAFTLVQKVRKPNGQMEKTWMEVR